MTNSSPLPETSYSELLLFILRRRRRFKVTGQSMIPSLKPGDEILLDPYIYRQQLPQVGDIVVTTHPHQKKLAVVKRISAITEDGSYFLTGDNPAASTDSRDWGTIKLRDIIGKATSLFI